MGGLEREMVRRGLKVGLVLVGVLALAGCARGSVQSALGLGKRSPDEFAVVKRAPLIIPPEYDLRPPDPGAPRPNIGRTADQARVAVTGSTQTPSEASRVLAGTRPPSEASRVLAGSTTPSANAPAATARSSAAPGTAAAVADDLLAAGTRAPANGTVAAPPPTTASTQAPAPQAETRGEVILVTMAGGDQADPAIRRALAQENQALADVEASLFTKVVKWRDPSTLGATIDAPAEAQRLRSNQIAGKSPTDGDTPTVVNRRQSALQEFLGDIF
jgi:hypothetical protein